MTTTALNWRETLRSIALFLRTVVGPQVLAICKSGKLGTEEKRGFKDIKTEGDTTAERLITGFLKALIPMVGIRGEEGASERGDGDIEAIVDPIDGTTAYASGMSQFGISIGFARKGVPEAGVIRFPVLGITIHAMKGGGASVNGKLIVRVPYSGAQNEKVIAADLADGTEHLFVPLRKKFASVLSLGAHVYAALLVAEGKLKAYVSTGATPFDMCAAIIIVRESGGVAIGIDGDDIDLSKEKSGIIYARTRELAEEVRITINDALSGKKE